MKYHIFTKKIIDLLAKNNCWFETFEHEPVTTSEEAAQVRHGYSLTQGAKALIMYIKTSQKDAKFIMLVVPGDRRFDNQKVKKLLGIKDFRFATKDEIVQVTDGVEIGGVPPFGNLFGIEVIADPKLFKHESIVFNAGDRRFSIGMKSTDYQALVQPQIVDIT